MSNNNVPTDDVPIPFAEVADIYEFMSRVQLDLGDKLVECEARMGRLKQMIEAASKLRAIHKKHLPAAAEEAEDRSDD